MRDRGRGATSSAGLRLGVVDCGGCTCTVSRSVLSRMFMNEHRGSVVDGYYHCPMCRPRGPMDKAPDYESGDSRFESWRGRIFWFHK